MHAGIHELLKLRDGTATGAAAAHVQGCAECRRELGRLRTMTSQLRALPAVGAAPERWAAIEAALVRPVSSQQSASPVPGWRWPLAAAAAVVAVVAIAVAPSWRLHAPSPPSAGEWAREAVIAEPGPPAVIAEARELEQALSAFSERPAVMHAGTALTLAELQDRLSWVDYRLALGAEAGIEPQQSERLWRERVDVLNSLVAVRYAQARTTF